MKFQKSYVVIPSWILMLPALFLTGNFIGLKNLDFVFFILLIVSIQKSIDEHGQELPMTLKGRYGAKIQKFSKVGLCIFAALLALDGWIYKLIRYLIETYT